MSQTQRISRNNTTIAHHPDGTRVVTLHRTPVVTVTDDTVVLNTGGWFTATTRTRITQVCNEWGLGWGVSVRKGKWFARHHDGREVPFNGAEIVTLPRE